MEIYQYTLRALMLEVGMTYEGTYSMINRMRRKGLVKDLGIAKAGARNAKLFGLTMRPNEYLEEERSAPKVFEPPSNYYHNPFNLKNAEDLRWNDLRNSI